MQCAAQKKEDTNMHTLEELQVGPLVNHGDGLSCDLQNGSQEASLTKPWFAVAGHVWVPYLEATTPYRSSLTKPRSGLTTPQTSPRVAFLYDQLPV